MKSVSLYAGDVRLEFDETLHAYRWGEKLVPGVTKIIGILDKPALVQWAANMAAEYIGAQLFGEAARPVTEIPAILNEAKTAHRKLSKSATDIGKEVHSFAERALVEQRVKLPKDPQTRKGCEAFLTWLHATDMKPINVERMVFSRMHYYAGTCDFFGHINGELCVMDLKTSSGLYREMPIQLAAYAVALQEETGERIDHAWIVRLDKKSGKCEPLYIPMRQSLKSAWLDVRKAYDATKLADALVEEVKEASKRGTRTCLTLIPSTLAAELG